MPLRLNIARLTSLNGVNLKDTSNLRSFSQSSPGTLSKCPVCGSSLPTRLPTCTNCSYISPVDAKASYHALLDVPAEPNPFIVDTAKLKRSYLMAQRVCHPDAWSGKDEKLQSIAASQSSLLNKAYYTLLSPVQRAQYLLAQHGQAMAETEQLQNQALIMEVMDAREELEEASSEEEIELVQKANKIRADNTIKELEEAFANLDYALAKDLSIKLKYWEGIEDAARAKLRDS